MTSRLSKYRDGSKSKLLVNTSSQGASCQQERSMLYYLLIGSRTEANEEMDHLMVSNYCRLLAQNNPTTEKTHKCVE